MRLSLPMRRHLATTLLVLSCALAGSAAARPPPPPDDFDDSDDGSDDRPVLEWSTWFRIGVGMEERRAPDAIARTTSPEVTGQETAWEAALGADATLPISDSGDTRIGAWVEARGLSVVAGGELVFAAVPKRLRMFWYTGNGQLSLRVGGNAEHGTVAVAYGYRAPWNLFRPSTGTSRYMIGVRLVASATRAHDDPQDWKAMVGIEVEPIGALRYLLGIRSLY